MKKTPLLLLVACTGILSCHKNSGSGPNAHGPRLSRYVLNRGDSVVYEMQYNAAGLVTKFTFTGNGFGPNLNIQTTQLFRDRNGMVTEMIDAWPDADSALNPPDTTLVSYDNAHSHYTYMVANYFNLRDSTAFSYNGAGQISQQQLYIRDASVSPLYALREARYYLYDQRGNLVTDSLVAISGSYIAPQWAYHYTYDNHPNPLVMGNDALLILDRDWVGMPHINGWCSANNAITAQAVDIQSPVSSFSMQRTFGYSSSGLPTGSTDQWVATQYSQPYTAETRYYY